MVGRAAAPAAGTVLNALANGYGSAFAIDAYTEAFVELDESGQVTGEIDAMGFAWSANGGMEAQLAGHDVNMIFMSDYGILEYPNAIFTAEQMIEENSDVIERFVRATLKGYQYAIENPDEVVEFALERNDSLDPELQAASMDAFVPLIDSGDAPIGWMDAEVWQSTQSILVDQAFIDSPVEPSLLYTNEFVEAAQ